MQHKLPSPRLGSTNYLHLPTTSRSLLVSSQVERFVQWYRILVAPQSLVLAYRAGWQTSLVKVKRFVVGPLNPVLDDPLIEEMPTHSRSYTADMAQVQDCTVQDLAVIMGAAGVVEDNVPCRLMSQSVVVVVVHSTCVKHSTYLEERGSYWSTTILGCKNTRGQTEEYCCTRSGIRTPAAHYWWEGLEKGSWARSKTTQSCRTSASYRSGWTKSQVIQVNQPGVTKYQTSMPAAALAKAERATYHSHTIFDLRDDCRMARQKVPGFAPVISTGDPAFRLGWSSPKWTMVDRLSEEPLGASDRDVNGLCDRLREVGSWNCRMSCRT